MVRHFISLTILLVLGNHAIGQAPDSSFKEIVIWDTTNVTKKHARVVITSDREAKPDLTTWEGRWKYFIEQRSVRIGQELLKRDSSRRLYKVLIEFSINADETIRDLKISCDPYNEFVINACRKMVMDAPKRKAVYNNGKYVRAYITQPIDIKVTK